MDLPREVNIMGIIYKIEYYDKPSDVDVFKRTSLWGQYDSWTRTIRVYNDGKLPITKIWQTIFHELLHAIADVLNIKNKKLNDEEQVIDILSSALIDVLSRNGWMKL